MKISYGRAISFIIVLLIGGAATLAGLRVEEYTSSTRFCLSCHSMSFPYERLKGSVHYGTLGINPECGDCHMPPGLFKRSLVHVTAGIKDTINTFRIDLSTEEEYDRHRDDFREKAVEALRSWDSSPCRACHKSPRPESGFGRAAHASMANGEATCVDCHRGIFHGP